MTRGPVRKVCTVYNVYSGDVHDTSVPGWPVLHCTAVTVSAWSGLGSSVSALRCYAARFSWRNRRCAAAARITVTKKFPGDHGGTGPASAVVSGGRCRGLRGAAWPLLSNTSLAAGWWLLVLAAPMVDGLVNVWIECVLTSEVCYVKVACMVMIHWLMKVHTFIT